MWTTCFNLVWTEPTWIKQNKYVFITFSHQSYLFKMESITSTQEGLAIMHRSGLVGWVSSIILSKLNQWQRCIWGNMNVHSIIHRAMKYVHELSFVKSEEPLFFTERFISKRRAEDEANKSTRDKREKGPHGCTKEANLICQDQTMTKARGHYE